MLIFKYYIEASKIPLAGKGLFTEEFIPKGKILIIPNAEHTLFTKKEFKALPKDSIEYASSIRWFEETYSVDPEWSPESHLNHSFSPNALWHLGFVFALKDLNPGDEVTIDYTFLLDEETELEFKDSLTNRAIIGRPFKDKMYQSTVILQSLFL